MESVPAEFANRVFGGEHPVRVYRDWRGLTAGALSAAVGLSAGHLSDIESGRRSPSAKALQKLAQALGLTPEDLIPATLS